MTYAWPVAAHQRKADGNGRGMCPANNRVVAGDRECRDPDEWPDPSFECSGDCRASGKFKGISPPFAAVR